MRYAFLIHTFLLHGIVALTCALAQRAIADDLFTEDFTTNSANWANFNSSNILTHFASGGPDGGGYASGPRNFNNLFPSNTTIFHRARHENPFNSSGDAFKRDYLEENITDISLFVRHNFTAGPLTYLLRIASSDNSRGHVYQADGPAVVANQWTEINFDISRFSPTLLSDEGNTYYQALHDVGYVTFGVFVPGGLPTNVNGSNNHSVSYAFDLDKVTISTPEPTSALLGGVGLLGMMFNARRRRQSTN